MQVSLPKYCLHEDATPVRQRRAQFLIRLAALYYSPLGQLSDLANALEMHPTSLSGYGEISPKLAIKIEELLGREQFPRELLRPDLFLIAEA